MQLTDADILEFQKLCREQLSLELAWEAAQEHAVKLIRLIQVVYRPMALEEFEAIRKLDTAPAEGDENEKRIQDDNRVC